MPFVSKSQWRQCFAAARRGQRKVSQCKEFAAMSKSYKSLPASLADAQRLPEKVRKLRRTRRRIHQKAPTTALVFISEDDFLERDIPVGIYARDEEGQWRQYWQSGPNQFDEAPFEDPIEDPEQIDYLEMRLNPEIQPMYEQTPYNQPMDEEEPMDIETPYGMNSPSRSRRGVRKSIKKRGGSKRRYHRQH